jgi:hypothetical protein
MHDPGEASTQVDEYTGIALANFDSIPANLTLTAFGTSGKKVEGSNISNPAYWIITPRAQMPKLDYQLFCSGSCDVTPIAYVKVESTSAKLDAFYMFFDGDLTVLDGANISSTPLTDLVLTEIADAGFTKIDVTNPNPDPVQLTLELRNASGALKRARLMFVDGSGALSLDVSADLFPEVAPAPGDYIRVTAGKGVFLSEMFGKQAVYVNILSAQDVSAAATTLYSPQYVVGGNYRSSLSVVNLDNVADTVTFRLFDKNGALLGARDLQVAAMGKLHITDQDFFGSFGSGVEGYVQITSQQARLAGSVVFGDPGRSRFSSALPLISTLQQTQVFSHVASDTGTWFMGIAVINPNSTNAAVTLAVYDKSGNLDRSATITVPAGGRESKLLTQYFPSLAGVDRTSGYVKLTSTQGVAAFALFGTQNLNVLSAIPAQTIR